MMKGEFVMGWTYTHKDSGVSAAEFLKRELFTFSHVPEEQRPTVVADAGTDFVINVPASYIKAHPEDWFSCYEREADGSVNTLVAVLTARSKDHYNFGYKDLAETSGPYKNTNASLLKYLTPLRDDGSSMYQWAKEFRDRIQSAKESKARVAKITDGVKIKLEYPVKVGGVSYDTFTARSMRYRQGRKIIQNGRVWVTPNGMLVRLSKETVRNAKILSSAS